MDNAQNRRADDKRAPGQLQWSESGEAAAPAAGRFSYTITPRAAHVGGGWRLQLLEDGQEVGGGIYPVTEEVTSDDAHQEAMDDGEAWLMSRGESPVDPHLVTGTGWTEKPEGVLVFSPAAPASADNPSTAGAGSIDTPAFRDLLGDLLEAYRDELRGGPSLPYENVRLRFIAHIDGRLAAPVAQSTAGNQSQAPAMQAVSLLRRLISALDGKRAAGIAGEPGFEFNDQLWALLEPARAVVNGFPATAINTNAGIADRLSLWLSASLDDHLRQDEYRKHIRAWLEFDNNGVSLSDAAEAARYRYIATLRDWHEIERMCWSTSAESAEEFKRGLDKHIDGKLTDLSADQAECIARIRLAAPVAQSTAGAEQGKFAERLYGPTPSVDERRDALYTMALIFAAAESDSAREACFEDMYREFLAVPRMSIFDSLTRHTGLEISTNYTFETEEFFEVEAVERLLAAPAAQAPTPADLRGQTIEAQAQAIIGFAQAVADVGLCARPVIERMAEGCAERLRALRTASKEGGAA